MMLFLNILKIIGIILLCILLLFIILLACVLFVPVRYQLKANRKADDETIIHADIKLTWLLHFITATFSYPTQNYLKLKVWGIPVYSSLKQDTSKTQQTEKPADNKISSSSVNGKEKQTEAFKEKTPQMSEQESEYKTQSKSASELESELEQKLSEEEDIPTIKKFIQKLFNIVKNIKYTILKLYDKIKKIIKDIRYYIAVLKSNCFQRAYAVCKTEIYLLVKSICPRKITGNFVVGTGDPASTAQILAIHGMLYPFIGNHINITPDFENSIFEGDLFIKGKITVVKLLRTAIKIYFNRDIRKVIRLLKREAA